MRQRFCRAATAILTAAAVPATPGAWAASPVQTWPETPPWLVVLEKGEKSPVCTALAPRLDEKVAFIAAFAFSRTSTHFYVKANDKALPVPETMTLLADRRPIYSGPIERIARPTPAGGPIRIDLPDDTLTHTIMPALIHASALQVQLGEAILSVPTPDMAKVLADLPECVKEGNKLE